MVADHNFSYLNHVKVWLSVAATPIYWLADAPFRISGLASKAVASHSQLVEDNARLKARNLILEHKVQKMASMTAQNIRLKELLNSSELVDEEVVIAEIISANPDPFSHIVMLNKGSVDGVFPGQAIVDAHGVMGQVIKVTLVASKVMLITDTSSRVPIQSNRTAYRAIAAGTGNSDQLELLHVPKTADFKEGDLLTSSGLGQRYPAGYPFGTVKSVKHEPGQLFATIFVQPVAEMNRGRLVLLVFRKEKDVVNDSKEFVP